MMRACRENIEVTPRLQHLHKGFQWLVPAGDGVVRLWDIVALRATRRFEQGKVGVTAVAFDKHQDVSQIASGAV